eukprot:4438202-Prymnesium_polylepis.2
MQPCGPGGDPLAAAHPVGARRELCAALRRDVAGVKDGNLPARRVQPREQLVEGRERELIALGCRERHVGVEERRRRELRAWLLARRAGGRRPRRAREVVGYVGVALATAPPSQAEGLRLVAAPAQELLELAAEEALAARRQADEYQDELGRIWCQPDACGDPRFGLVHEVERGDRRGG